MNRARPGYMIVFTLMIIALTMVMVVGLVTRARVHVSTMRVLLDQEKARMLALSGLEMAKSRLANKIKDEEPSSARTEPGRSPSAQQDPLQEARAFLGVLMPQLVSGSKFEIHEKKSLYGDIRFCIGCEQGKININKLYNFTRHEFLDEQDTQKSPKLLVEKICKALESKMGGKGLFEKLTDFLSKRSYPLNDITEIFAIKEFATVFADGVFLDPVASKNSDDGRKKIYFTDLFTTWGDEKSIQPWLMSPSLQRALDFKQIDPEQQDLIKQVLETFSLQASWPNEWNRSLAKLYGKDFSMLSPSLISLLSTKFEPMVFSVVSYGSVKNSTQRLYAVVERTKSQESGGPLYEVSVKRLYWF